MVTRHQKNPAGSLQPGEIQLWVCFPEQIRDDALLVEFEKLMTPEERKRHRRYRFARHRHRFLVTRALVRTMLSRFTGVAPGRLRFAENDYGRPELIFDDRPPPVRFNLSHTQGVAVCAVVLTHEIGVDVEPRQRRVASEKIAQRFFSPAEVEELEGLKGPIKQDRFFEYWTLKESYIKARGMGLSIPLAQFSFHFSKNKPIRIAFDPRLRDDPDQWQFWLLSPTPVHQAALCVRRKTGTPSTLFIKKAVPLVGEEAFECPIATGSRTV